MARRTRRRRTARTLCSLDHGPHEIGDEEPGAEGREHRRKAGQEPQPDHPLALSTRRTVNGFPPGGVTSKSRPQWPTITSAGSVFEKSPRCFSVSAYSRL